MKIEGFFDNIKNANQTVEQLKSSGYSHAYVDINDHYIADRNIEINFPGGEDGSSLSDLVLGSGSNAVRDRGKAPLAAANPMVSGMGTMNEVADILFLRLSISLPIVWEP